MSDEAMPLLLHSLTEASQQIDAALEVVRPARIVEIGSESGGMTHRLVAWARDHGAEVVSIDPQPPAALQALVDEGAPLRVVAAPSPAALEGITGDAWIIDGDHNYATVAAELRHVFAGDGDGPPRLAILHDVGWPCARRDAYYAPDRIAEADRHPFSYQGGVALGHDELVDAGFSGRGAFAWALTEGAERSGVLTAVEDVMDELGGLRLDVIPCLFGVGFLYPDDAPWTGELAERLAPHTDAELLRRLEHNRLTLYLRVLELQAELEAERAERDRVLATLQTEIGRLDAAALAAGAGGVTASSPADR